MQKNLADIKKKRNPDTYLPLPSILTIRPSPIHGLGIFATEDIEKDTSLGITHVYNLNFPQNWIRTPLGGHYNHSDKPNCYLKESYLGESFVDNQSIKVLITLKNISAGDEITCTYTLYSLCI